MKAILSSRLNAFNITKARQSFVHAAGDVRKHLEADVMDLLVAAGGLVRLNHDAFTEVAYLVGEVAAEMKKSTLDIYNTNTFKVRIVTGSLMDSIRSKVSEVKGAGTNIKSHSVGATITIYIDEGASRHERPMANSMLDKPINTGESVDAYKVLSSTRPDFMTTDINVQNLFIQHVNRAWDAFIDMPRRTRKSGNVNAIVSSLLSALNELKAMNEAKYHASINARVAREKEKD
jgi:hypothetical protein